MENLENCILSAHNLSHQVTTSSNQKLSILQQINLNIERSQSVAIVGTSGSGKSTLLGILAGLDLPSSGFVSLLGHNLSSLNEDERAKLRLQYVGFVFQTFQLLENLTALENVMLPLELKDEQNARQIATDLMMQVGLGERLDHLPRTLSGGEQQRVAIARAFAARPKILFADEPTGNLDAATGSHISELIFNLNLAFGTTLVLVTHDAKLAQKCGRQIRLEQGELV